MAIFFSHDSKQYPRGADWNQTLFDSEIKMPGFSTSFPSFIARWCDHNRFLVRYLRFKRHEPRQATHSDIWKKKNKSLPSVNFYVSMIERISQNHLALKVLELFLRFRFFGKNDFLCISDSQNISWSYRIKWLFSLDLWPVKHPVWSKGFKSLAIG